MVTKIKKRKFMEWFPIYTSSLYLVQNLTTEQLLSQSFIIFDPWFTTILENNKIFPIIKNINI